MLMKEQRESKRMMRCLVFEYIKRLEVEIKNEKYLEESNYEAFKFYKRRRIAKQSELVATQRKLKEDLRMTNFIHFCQTGRYLDEVQPGEWMKFL